MTTNFSDLHLEALDPTDVPRVLLTLSCRDADALPKVEGAGDVVQRDGQSLQVMHNGLLIEEGCYYGPWMTEVIRGLNGHHEPQEEVVFDAIVSRIAHGNPSAPIIIEFGSFWAYYTMWFTRALAGSRGIAIEPDPAYLEIGRRNAALNSLSDQITFVQGAVGAEPGNLLDFTTESTGDSVSVKQYDLDSLFAEQGLESVDLAMIDIQGFESVLLGRGRKLLASGAIRFAIVSTHHYRISGDHLTHQNALDLLRDIGGHIIAEHSVGESFSGDGLIAVAFHPDDADLTVPISHARATDSVFGSLEYDLAEFAASIVVKDESLAHYQRHVAHIESVLASQDESLEEARKELGRLASELAARDASIAHYERHVARIEGELDKIRRDARLRNAADARANKLALSAELERLDTESELGLLSRKLIKAQESLAEIRATRLIRWSAVPRRIYGSIRRRIR